MDIKEDAEYKRFFRCNSSGKRRIFQEGHGSYHKGDVKIYKINRGKIVFKTVVLRYMYYWLNAEGDSKIKTDWKEW